MTLDLVFLNSVTKYPSIPTWHVMGEKGRLTDQTACDHRGPWHLTEKIDGTNARVIFVDGDWFIGSREELLCARGDRIGNPALSIVDTIRRSVDLERLRSRAGTTIGSIVVFYGEVYGGKVTAGSKNYTREGVTGVRFFDRRWIPSMEVKRLMGEWQRDPGSLSAWRETPACFDDLATLKDYCESNGLVRVPEINGSPVESLPTELVATRAWLENVAGQVTRAYLDEEPVPITGPGFQVEGIVARTADRSRIVKLRIEDYRRFPRGGSA